MKSLILGIKQIEELWYQTFGDVILIPTGVRFVVPTPKWIDTEYVKSFADNRRKWNAETWEEGDNMCGRFSLSSMTYLSDLWLNTPKEKNEDGTLPLLGLVAYRPKNAKLSGDLMDTKINHAANWTVRARYSGSGDSQKLTLKIQGIEPQLAAKGLSPFFNLQADAEIVHLGML